MNRLDTILRLHEFGHRLHPLEKGGKKPVMKNWPEVEVTIQSIQTWFTKGLNFGVICDKIGVLDFDAKEPAREFFAENRQLIKTIVLTRRGVHYWFANPQGFRNSVGTPDFRGPGGYVLSPGSLLFPDAKFPAAHLYRFVDGYDEIDPEKMEPLRAEWLPKRNSVGSVRGRVTDGVKYIMHIHAVSGEGGHNATFRACCKLRDSGMSEAEALAAMVEWNKTNAEPPWEVKELLHKVRDAFTKVA